MRSLFIKDLRSLCPFFTLIFLIHAIYLLEYSLMESIDLVPLPEFYLEVGSRRTEFFVIAFLLGFSLASGLLVREFDDGTIELLAGLPISRSAIFASKVALGALILAAEPVLETFIMVIRHALSRTSLDPDFHWSFLAVHCFVNICQYFVIFSFGLCLSFLRRFSWIIAMLCYWSFEYLRVHNPVIEVLNVSQLTMVEFIGQSPVLPSQLLGVQMSMAFGFLLLAYIQFLGGGGWLLQMHESLTRHTMGRAFLGVATVVLISLAMSVMAYLDDSEEEAPDDERSATFPTWTRSRYSTENYAFLYDTSLAGTLQGRLDVADEVHDRVLNFLSGEPAPSIAVDLTSESEHYAGTAHWKKIRMRYDTIFNAEHFASVLAHETAHVYIDLITENRLLNDFNSTRFLHEGLATYVEYRFFHTEKELDQLHSRAAVAHDRGETKFETLIDGEKLSAEHDLDLVYPLGEVFIRSFVEIYGDHAPIQLLKAVPRENQPEGLEGFELWQDSFQFAGFNLEQVIDQFYETLEDLQKDNEELLELLPRLAAKVYEKGESVHIDYEGEAPPGFKVVCRIRQYEDSGPESYFNLRSEGENGFTIPRCNPSPV